MDTITSKRQLIVDTVAATLASFIAFQFTRTDIKAQIILALVIGITFGISKSKFTE